MLQARRLLQIQEFTDSEEQIEIKAQDTSDLLEEEVQIAIAAMSTHQPDSEEYMKIAASIDTLCEAIQRHDNSATEREKIRLQIVETNRRQNVEILGAMVPRLVAVLVYAGLTAMVICIERQTPLSMRWLRAADVLLAPKGL